MDRECRFSMSPQTLYSRLGSEAAPVVVDVRRGARFDADDLMVLGAIRRVPDAVDQWRRELPRGRAVVAYCAYGREVGQTAAAALRAVGTDASYLEGGIEAWAGFGLPRRRKLTPQPDHG